MVFGSDFHKIEDLTKGYSILEIIGECNLYADRRQALEDILINDNINIFWLRSY